MSFLEGAKKVLTAVKRFFVTFAIELLIIAVGIFLDQLSKGLVFKHVGLGNSVPVIKNFFYITATENDGAAFSILRGQTWFFILFPTVASIAFSAYLFHKKNNNLMFLISLPMVIAGTIGNLLDRIFNAGNVRDFFHVTYMGHTIFNSTYFPIFNVADMLLVVGIIVFSIYFIFFHKPEPKEAPAKEAEAEPMPIEEEALDPRLVAEALKYGDKGAEKGGESQSSKDE